MQLTHEHEQLRDTIRRWIATDINPHVEAWEAAEIFPAHQVFKQMGELGLLGLDKPVEDGGAGLDYSYAAVLAETLSEMNCGGVPMAIGVQTDMCTPALARHGSAELRAEFLAPLTQGRFMFAMGFRNVRQVVLACLVVLMQAWIAAPAYAQAAPTISSVTPNTSSVNGGTTIVITGTNFVNVSRVYFSGSNNVDVASYTVNSSTQITAVTAAFSPMNIGRGAIVVDTATGSGSLYGFEVLPALTITNAATLYIADQPAASGITALGGRPFCPVVSRSMTA